MPSADEEFDFLRLFYENNNRFVARVEYPQIVPDEYFLRLKEDSGNEETALLTKNITVFLIHVRHSVDNDKI